MKNRAVSLLTLRISHGRHTTLSKLKDGTEITYYGHSTFMVKTPKGKNVLIDPWVKGNPACPEKLHNIGKVDVIAITHGHFDHISDAVEIAKEHKPQVVANWEICAWLGTKGVENCCAMNKGGGQTVEGVRFVMTHAQHSSGIGEEDGSTSYGGEPGGFVIELENGYRMYHAGDTNIFSDMKLIKEIYAPKLAFLPIGDLFTMGPLEASYACKFISPDIVIPMHYATFPPLTGTPEELEKLTTNIKGLEIAAMKPGETLK